MEDYRERMEQVIEPFLQKYRKQFWFEREEGKKLYCLSYRLESPRGVVLISHGFTENEEKYKENIYRFLKQNYTVYFMEHCGHGRSYRLVEDLSLVHVDRFERYVDDFIAFSKLVKEENKGLPLYLFGHSMGGGIAAAVAAREPHMFQKLVLSSPMIRPNTGKLPWSDACIIAKTFCKAGKSEEYVVGFEPYQGEKPLTRTSSSREDQNSYYQEIKKREPLFHTNAPSYGWVYEAVRLNRYLKKKAPKKIKIPVLLFQAERDTLVSNREQVRFILRLRKAGLMSAKLVRVPEAKHEVFNAKKRTRETFWKMVFRFLES